MNSMNIKEYDFNIFYDAIEQSASKLSNQIESINTDIKDLSDSFARLPEYNNDGQPNEERLNLKSELEDLKSELDYYCELRLSLEEMKIIFLYKNFEILIKKIIEQIDPNFDVKGFDRWSNIKQFLESRDISTKTINELRVVNNNIKHVFNISDEVFKLEMKEFKFLEKFDYISLLLFYDRIKDEPQKIIDILSDKYL